MEVEPQKIEVTGTGVLGNEQQCGHDNDGRDDLPSGGTPSLFAEGFDSSITAMTFLLSKVAIALRPGRSLQCPGHQVPDHHPPKGDVAAVLAGLCAAPVNASV